MRITQWVQGITVRHSCHPIGTSTARSTQKTTTERSTLAATHRARRRLDVTEPTRSLTGPATARLRVKVDQHRRVARGRPVAVPRRRERSAVREEVDERHGQPHARTGTSASPGPGREGGCPAVLRASASSCRCDVASPLTSWPAPSGSRRPPPHRDPTSGCRNPDSQPSWIIASGSGIRASNRKSGTTAAGRRAFRREDHPPSIPCTGRRHVRALI